MKKNKHIALLLFLLFCGFPNLFAEDPQQSNIQIGGANNKQYNEYIKTLIKNIINNDTTAIKTVVENVIRKELMPILNALDEQKKEKEQLLVEYEQEKSISRAVIAQLKEELQIYKTARFLLENRQKELHAKRWNSLPLIHQFATKQTGKGIVFSRMEAVLLGTGIGYCISAQNNLKKHKDPKYEQWERNNFYEKYENQLSTSGWWFAGAGAMILLIYCDNFNWFRKNNIELVSTPLFDWQGKPQMAMTVNIKF
ncbi:MAG: hypothetical protein LBT48_00200 [Prevotellaceae bacterium]|jgi:hypothetical protein|nr:hypothetical protein [Prevotellaceae bacterium]